MTRLEPRRPRIRKLATVLVALHLATGCGALDDSAPPTAKPSHCTTVDQRLAPLMALAHQGKTSHLAALVAERLDPAGQRAVVQLVLDIAYALPGDISKDLPDLLAPSGLGALVPLLVAILAPLPGDPQAVPPIPPKIEAMKAFSAVAQSCLSQEMFVLGKRLFAEPEAADAVAGLLGAGSGGVKQILGAVQAAGAEGRAGLQTLVRNLMTSLAADDFTPEPLLALLDRLVDPANPGALGAVNMFLHSMVLGHSPGDRQQALQALGGFAKCMLALDPDMEIAGHGYDVLANLDLPDTATVTIDTHRWLPIVSIAMDVLASHPASRDAWSQLLGLLLRPETGIAALPDLVELMESEALPGVFGLLADLVALPCQEQP